MRLVLKVANGAYEGRTVLLQTGQTVKVGRTEWADFSVPHDASISSVHFAVECQRQRCFVRDLDSTNGTTVNDAAVTETELQDGDVIVAGGTRFKVTVEITESVYGFDPIVLPKAADDLQTSISEESEPAVPTTPGPRATASDFGDAVHDENEPARLVVESPSTLPEPPAPSLVATDPVVSEHPSRRSLDATVRLTAVDKPLMTLALMLAAQSERPYAAALEDPDAAVRRETLYAAAWSGESWLLEFCRCLANEPLIEYWGALHLLGILGEPSDLERIVRVGRTAKLGSRRFSVYASYGHPRIIRDLLIAMEDEDAHTAVAAGVAFTKITGADIDSEERVQLQPEDGSEPDEFEQEFLDEAFLPNPKLAQQHWSKVKDRFSEGTRWRRGIDLTAISEPALMGQMEMEGRWELCLRMAYHGLPYAHLLPVRLRSGPK